MRTKSAAKSATQSESMNVVDMLKSDHRKVEKMFSDFEASSKKSEKMKLVKELINELTIHTTLEEKLVYPILLEEDDDEEATREAYEEHSVVKNVLKELASMSGSEENLDAKVKVLSELIKHHVKEEENELLPALKECDVDLEDLGQEVMEAKEKLMMKNSKNKTASKSRSLAKSTNSRRKAS